MLQDTSFVDDTAFYLQASYKNLQRTHNLLQTHNIASCLKVKWNKTHVIQASWRLRSTRQGQDFGLHQVEEGKGVQYLGPLIEFHYNPQANALRLMCTIKAKLHNWAVKQLSLVGMILICNRILLAPYWYVASYCGLDKQKCNIIKSLIRNYLQSWKEDDQIRAQLQWNSCILLSTSGKVKQFDFFIQTQALSKHGPFQLNQ